MAILYKKSEVAEPVDGEYTHLIKFKSSDKIQYYLLGAWEQEINGIKTKEEFTSYLDQKLSDLENPIAVALN